ncbi:MAG: pyridoxamine 5'-phosphate oxidase family protein [Campylobacterales bacterium]|nr:pyridoxamine 5'-phosphate oxidase family protein [Campylobacterales bacterium]
MSVELQKIHSFIDKHHVLTLATSNKDEISACSLFYAFEAEENIFVVASSDDTLHINHIQKNPKIAGNILLETDEVGKIQGLQFRGVFKENQVAKYTKLYLKKFPYAIALKPKLWIIEVDFFKLTDNRLGFGKKIIWP